jgi:hypothetical protein
LALFLSHESAHPVFRRISGKTRPESRSLEAFSIVGNRRMCDGPAMPSLFLTNLTNRRGGTILVKVVKEWRR